jgi:hypothetical protein
MSKNIETAAADKAIWDLWNIYNIKLVENLKLACIQIECDDSNQLNRDRSVMGPLSVTAVGSI